MATTINNLRTKLTTHASTAGASQFLWGWLDEINAYLTDKTTKYPCIIVQPEDWDLNPRGYESFPIDLHFQVLKQWQIDSSTTRSAIFDNIVTIAKAFITAINTDANLEVDVSEIPIKLYDLGTVVENALMIDINIKMEVWC